MATIPLQNSGFHGFPPGIISVIVYWTVKEKKVSQQPVRVTLIKLDDKVIRHIVLRNGTIIESGLKNDN